MLRGIVPRPLAAADRPGGRARRWALGLGHRRGCPMGKPERARRFLRPDSGSVREPRRHDVPCLHVSRASPGRHGLDRHRAAAASLLSERYGRDGARRAARATRSSPSGSRGSPPIASRRRTQASGRRSTVARWLSVLVAGARASRINAPAIRAASAQTAAHAIGPPTAIHFSVRLGSSQHHPIVAF